MMKSCKPFSRLGDDSDEPNIPIDLSYLYNKIDGVEVETDVPDGVYDVGIEEAKMETSDNNTPQFKWTLRIKTGDYADHKITRYDSLYHSPESAKLCRRDLYTCGYPVDNFDLLKDQSYCDHLIGIRLLILLISNETSIVYYMIGKF